MVTLSRLAGRANVRSDMFLYYLRLQALSLFMLFLSAVCVPASDRVDR